MLDAEKSPLLECALDTMQEVFFAFSPEGNIVEWNHPLEEVTGLAGKEIEELRLADLVPEREAELVREQIEKVLEKRRARFKSYLQTKDGQEIPYEFTGSLFSQNGGRLLCLTGRPISEAAPETESAEREIAETTQEERLGPSGQKPAESEKEDVQQIQKKNRLLRLMKEVTRSCNEAGDLNEALRGAIEAVCKHGWWQVGHAYLPERTPSEELPSEGVPSERDPSEEDPYRGKPSWLVPTFLWNQGSEERFEAFRAATERLRFAPGEGLPGQVFAKGEPVWIEDASQEERFLRRQAAEEAGLKSAAAFPVPSGEKTAAVLEFFSEEAWASDEELLEVMESVGKQIGRVAEREEVRRRLQSSVQQYRSMKESTVDGIALAGEEGLITDWNRGAEEIFGYKKAEIIGRPIEVLMPERHKEPHRKGLKRVNRTGKGRYLGETIELEGLRKSGEEFPVEISLSSWKTGGERRYAAIIRDITERRWRENELRKSERRYRRLFEDALEGIVITTPDGRVLDANPAAAKILDYNWGELKGMNTARLYANPGERKRIAVLLRREDGISGREVRLRRADGEEIICEISVTTRRGEEGDSEAYRTFFRDVTEQRKAEEALRESEELFRTLSERALVGVALLREDEYVYVNPAFAQITGRTPEEIIGRAPEVVFYPEDQPAVRRRVRERIEGSREEAHYEARMQATSGETRHVEILGSRIGYQGKPAIMSTVRDITEQRRLQREMIQVQEEERKRLGQDLHDSLASQLTGANLKLSTLSSRIQDEEEKEGLREVQSLIEESAGDVRRLSHGLNPAGLPEGDLLSALEGLASNTEGAHLESDKAEEDAELPPMDEEVATHLYRIAQEAANNARKYAEASKIAIRLREEGGTVALEVEDDGTGFDPSQVGEKGLGLRSMRRRAELLGAELDIESATGEGTLVRCLLPI